MVSAGWKLMRPTGASSRRRVPRDRQAKTPVRWGASARMRLCLLTSAHAGIGTARLAHNSRSARAGWTASRRTATRATTRMRMRCLGALKVPCVCTAERRMVLKRLVLIFVLHLTGSRNLFSIHMYCSSTATFDFSQLCFLKKTLLFFLHS